MTITPDYTFTRVLAIDPCRRGFGFAVLEGKDRLVDWGLAQVWARNDKEFLARVEGLVARYSPAILVLQEPDDRRRSKRAVRRIRLLGRHATPLCVRLRHVSNMQVKSYLAGEAATKLDIALAIARLFPELEVFIPRPRRPWTSEDDRMNVFDAVGLALATSSSLEKVGRSHLHGSTPTRGPCFRG